MFFFLFFYSEIQNKNALQHFQIKSKFGTFSGPLYNYFSSWKLLTIFCQMRKMFGVWFLILKSHNLYWIWSIGIENIVIKLHKKFCNIVRKKANRKCENDYIKYNTINPQWEKNSLGSNSVVILESNFVNSKKFKK